MLVKFIKKSSILKKNVFDKIDLKFVLKAAFAFSIRKRSIFSEKVCDESAHIAKPYKH